MAKTGYSAVLLAAVSLGCPTSDQSSVDAGTVVKDVAESRDTGWQSDSGFADAGFVPECYGHRQCDARQRCLNGRCIARVEAESGVLFEPYHIAALDTHRSGMPPLLGSGTEYSSVIGNLGFGGALFDFDGDHDLDLFVASQGYGNAGISPACIYENRSRPTAPVFVPVAEHCGDRTEMPHSGFGLDLEGDGFHELLLTGTTMMEVHRFHPERSIIDLRALVPTHDGRANCNPGAAVSMDFNWDGLVDIMLGCQHGPISRPPNATFHLVFLQTQAGEFRFLDRLEAGAEDDILLNAQAVTLALGGGDVNHDGLMDLIVCEDHMHDPMNEGDPGGIYLRCSPEETCRFRPYRLADFRREAGNYMGAGLLEVEGFGQHVYVTDIGANRLVELNSAPPTDRAALASADLATLGGDLLVAWGVVVDDFNRDGKDDLFVSQGSLLGLEPRLYEMHFDALFIQRDQGRFSLHSEDVGIAPFTREDSGHPANVYSARAVIKADLDNDGYLDLVEFGLEGRPRLHREVPIRNGGEPRCTLVASDRYSPAFGLGHALIPPGGGAERQWDSQGQMRAGTSPFVVSPWRTGHLRFPSGAKIAFDCGTEQDLLRVVEPEWIELERFDDRLSVRLAAAAPQGELAVWAEPARVLLGSQTTDEAMVVQLPQGTERIVLKIGERWVPRYFTP